MASFEAAFKVTMIIEGEYVNNPKDRGGETYKGIARRKNPNWQGWKLIDAAKSKKCFPKCLRKNEPLQNFVQLFYKENYWNRLSLSLFNNQSVAEKMFDIGVVMGTAVAAKMLQRSLNVANRNENYYKDLAEDGLIGQKTIAAMNTHPYPDVIFKCLNVLEGARFINLAERNQTQEAFINGWFMKRIAGIVPPNE